VCRGVAIGYRLCALRTHGVRWHFWLDLTPKSIELSRFALNGRAGRQLVDSTRAALSPVDVRRPATELETRLATKRKQANIF